LYTTVTLYTTVSKLELVTRVHVAHIAHIAHKVTIVYKGKKGIEGGYSMNTEKLVRPTAISPFTIAIIELHPVDILAGVECSLSSYEKMMLHRYSRGRIHGEARRIARRMDAE